MVKTWEPHKKVSFHNKGWILFNFATEYNMYSMKTKVHTPYAIFCTPFVLYDLPVEFRFDTTPNFNIPVWASLPRLPIELWDLKAITSIVVAVGSPLQVDTISLARNVNGPRFQVLMNAFDEPFETVEVDMHNDNLFKQDKNKNKNKHSTGQEI